MSSYSSPVVTDLGSIHELTLGGHKHTYTTSRSKKGRGHDARGAATKTVVTIHCSQGHSR